MIVFILMLIVVSAIYLLTKLYSNKSVSVEKSNLENISQDIIPNNNSGSGNVNIHAQLELFPDRNDAISFHKISVIKALSQGNFQSANLAFAKLVESVRQQNINLDGALESDFIEINRIYSSFRAHYKLEYPKQFLPRSTSIPNETSNKPPSLTDISKSEDEPKADSETYYIFRSIVNDKTPKDVIKHIDKIMTRSEWDEEGIKISNNGNIRSKYARVVSKTSRFTEVERNAIATKKRCTEDPYNILLLHRQGVALDEFAAITEQIKSYCSAYMLFENMNYSFALEPAKSAFESNKSYQHYADLYFSIRIALSDVTAIEDELNYNIKRVDNLIYSGRTIEWFKMLVNNNNKEMFLRIVDLLKMHLLESDVDQDIKEKTSKELVDKSRYYKGLFKKDTTAC